MTATDRFKALFLNTVERVCWLEEQLELTQAENARLSAALAEHEPPAEPEPTSSPPA